VENSYNDAFTLYLNETGKHTGKFRGQIQLSNSTIPQYGFIKVLAQGDTVQIRETISNNRAVVSYRQPSEPNIFYGIKFTTNITGNILKTDSLVLESNVFIKLSGNDPNPNIVDLVRVIIKNSRTGDTIVKVLYENSQGAYTGSFYLTAYTNGTLGYLGGLAGDVIVISNYSYSVFDTNQITMPGEPGTLNNLRFMNSDYTAELTGNIPPQSELKVEANGIDRNSLTIDTIQCYVKSNLDNSGISFVLTETTNNSGKYRGAISIGNYSDASLVVIKAFNTGDTIEIFKTVNGVLYNDLIAVQNSISPQILNYFDFVSFNDYTSIEGEVLPSEKIGVSVIGVDANSNSIDTVNISVYSVLNNDTIIFDAYETSKNSGIFRGIFELSPISTNATLKILKSGFGDTITGFVSDSTVVFDNLRVTIPSPPTAINSLIFMEENYSVSIGDYSDAYSKIFIEATGLDNNPYYRDTKAAVCYSTYDTIIVLLTETAKNSGIFRGYIELNNFSFETLNYIKAYKNGDTAAVYCGGKYDTVTVFLTASPATIISISIKEDENGLTNKTNLLTIGDAVYVEVVAVDANPLTIDTIPMRASVNASDFIEFVVIETGKNSNRYRGKFKIEKLSNDTIDELGVDYGDTLTIKSALTSDSITAHITIPQSPILINELIYTDKTYNEAWPKINQVNFGYEVFIRLTASDLNELTEDTFGVILYTLGENASDSVDYIYNLILKETGKHTGVFKGSVSLDVVKSVSQNRCKTKQGSFLALIPGDTPAEKISNVNSELANRAVDTIQTATPKPPTEFISVSLKKSSMFTDIKYSPIV